MSSPSSVRVPVLSKQKLLIAPHRLMLRGLMQKMFCLRSRFCAKTMPMVIAAGSAGGTTIVTRSNVRRNISPTSLPLSICTSHQINHHLTYLYLLRPVPTETLSNELSPFKTITGKANVKFSPLVTERWAQS